MRILVLAGTREARELITKLTPQVAIIASLAGVTATPQDLGVATRIGGFGGADGFKRFLMYENINMVVDATHPFAVKMTTTMAAVCQHLAIACVILQRPPWHSKAGDRWYFVDSPKGAVAIIGHGKTVFLTIGWRRLLQYQGLDGCRVFVRVRDMPCKKFLFTNGKFIEGKPPFSWQEEVDLLKRLAIEWLVVRNSGGRSGLTKLQAARALSLPVVMINRPPLFVHVPLVQTITQCMEWINENRSNT